MFPTDFELYKPFFVTGLALGGVYALSGVGIVVLYRATGVLNLAFGAIGAMGALISWTLVNHTSFPDWASYLTCIVFGGLVTFAYGVIFGPALAVDVTQTQIIALAFGVAVTFGVGAFLRFTKLGTAMRALADDREITSTLGVPVRRVEAAAWLGSGLIGGAAGLLLSDLVSLDPNNLNVVVISSLAAALIARLRSLVATLLAGLAIGLFSALLTPILFWPNASFPLSKYQYASPFVIAIVALLVFARRRVVTVARTEA